MFTLVHSPAVVGNLASAAAVLWWALSALPASAGAGASWTYTSTGTGTSLGHSVAPAGDVNGDGYSDFLLGEPLRSNGQAAEGRAYLFYGSATGPSATPGWTYEYNIASSLLGFAVSTAGDVNGDGFDDVLVGAPGYGSYLGRIELFFGSAAGLATSPGHSFNGSQANADYGTALSAAGDVNGDGYDDIVFGYPRYDATVTNGGRLVLYYGSASGIAPGSVVIAGNVAEGRLGNSVATAGDVNGDGYADVVAGSYLYSNGQLDEGRASVYHGGPAGLSTTAAWVAEGNEADMWFGYSVSTAGDVNGDGYSDVIIGAPHYDASLSIVNSGQVFVYLGGASGLAASAIWSTGGASSGTNLGWSVAAAGDVDGNGCADVTYGSPGLGPGFTNVRFGTPSTPPFSAFVLHVGQIPAGEFGKSVATAGDVNGDGFSDYLVGQPNAGGSGSVCLYFGSAPEPQDLPSFTTPDPVLTDGRSTSAGDVNGDGYSDIITAAARVYHGGANGLGVFSAWTAPASLVPGSATVGTAGDVNGDGYSDVIVGTPATVNPDGTQGAAHVFLGSSTGLAATPVWSVLSSYFTGSFGHRVDTAGDVNGDGFGDVLVAAASGGIGGGGYVSVYLGSPTGPSPAAAWVAYADQPSSAFGSDAGTAGDVNGDGYSDLIVGAPNYNFGNQEGAAFVYYGSSVGLSSFPDWFAKGETNTTFGTSVASAGDVNGDGYADVIVGNPLAFLNNGIASYFLGAPTGLQLNVASRLFGGVGQHLGSSVRGAGDVDHDGLSDVVITGFYSAFVHSGFSAGDQAFPSWLWVASSNLAGIRQASLAGDVNGDGFSDIVVGEAGAASYTLVYLGGGPGTRTRRPHQELADGSAPVALLGSVDPAAGFRVRQLASSPAGRSDVRLQVEVKPLGVPFNGVGIMTGPAADTGLNGVTLTQLVSGLQNGTPYHWRARVLGDSPYFPVSPWTSPEGNGANETDLLALDPAVSAPMLDFPLEHSGVSFAPPSPNPSTGAAAFRFALPQAGRVRLGVYDLAGRRVALLADEVLDAGHHTSTWDGASAHGRAVAAGVYFARLEVDGEVTTRKVVRAR